MTATRVALFTDSYYEANGVARTSSALETYAAERGLPLLLVHGGPADQLIESGSVLRLELSRSTLLSFGLEHDLRFDLALWRHLRRVSDVLRMFQPDVLHFTGPSDVGQLGAYLGHRLGIPMVASWHTNLHEYASRRLLTRLSWARDTTRMAVRLWVERQALSLTVLFYRVPRIVLAPNEEWRCLLEWRTRKPTFVMTRGIDTELFTPARRARTDGPLNVGYVGRLSPEKSVRVLAAVEAALLADGRSDVRFTIVGDGTERAWLEQNMTRAVFLGVLRGDELAAAYADMDLFAFPSETETVGNVVLEAMASGVPVVAMARGGHRFVVDAGTSAAIAHDEREFVSLAQQLSADRGRRETMGLAGRACALERSWEQVFDGVYRAYAEALSARPQPEQAAEGALVPVVEKQPFA
jgi:phosphatidylinositol alpha 1,6-mannosyltransferase